MAIAPFDDLTSGVARDPLFILGLSGLPARGAGSVHCHTEPHDPTRFRPYRTHLARLFTRRVGGRIIVPPFTAHEQP